MAIVLTDQQKQRIRALKALNLVSTEPTPFVRMVLDDYIRELAQENGMNIRDLDDLATRLDAGEEAAWPLTARPK